MGGSVCLLRYVERDWTTRGGNEGRRTRRDRFTGNRPDGSTTTTPGDPRIRGYRRVLSDTSPAASLERPRPASLRAPPSRARVPEGRDRSHPPRKETSRASEPLDVANTVQPSQPSPPPPSRHRVTTTYASFHRARRAPVAAAAPPSKNVVAWICPESLRHAIPSFLPLAPSSSPPPEPASILSHCLPIPPPLRRPPLCPSLPFSLPLA